MWFLIVGIVLWMAAHLFKRLLPGARQKMNLLMGEGPARGAFAGLIFLSIVLMILGYREEPYAPVYAPLPGMGHLNNLLMLVAIFLSGAGNSKGYARAWLRHPMLWSVVIWVGAHLLVNGDVASIVLFGSMGIWAILEMLLINRTEGAWQRPEPGPIKGDIKLAVISLVLFGIIVGIHIWLGHNPFLGTYA